MSIRASVSVQQIIPQKPAQLAGYPDVKRESSGIRDEITCSAIHLRSGGAGLVIMSLDLFSIDPAYLNRIRKAVQEATSTPAHNLFVGTTQNHSAPSASRFLRWYAKPGRPREDPAYIDLIVEQAAAAASEACVTSRPASLAYIDLDKPGTGAILLRENPSGKIMGILIVYEDIPNYLGPDNKELSSDFLAATRKQLAARFGENPIVCYFPAPQGTTKLLNYTQKAKSRSADEAGKALAELIVSKTKTLKKSDFTADVALAGEMIRLPATTRRRITTLDDAQKNLEEAEEQCKAKPLDALADDEKMSLSWTLANSVNTLGFATASDEGVLSHLFEDYRNFEIQKISIGDTTILGMPCTMTDECAKNIAKSKDGRVLIAECVNGDMESAILDVDGDSCGLLSPVFNVENGQPLLDTAKKILQQ